MCTTNPPSRPRPGFAQYTSNAEWAQFWFKYGLQVIPIIPGTNLPAVQCDPWLDGLSWDKIENHWAKNPKHDVGFIVGDDMVVLDADGPESEKALWALEQEHCEAPLLTAKTPRGCDHYFRRAPGTYVKTDAHVSIASPDRIDVKAKGSIGALPPSSGRMIEYMHAKCVGELMVVNQDFVDAVARHNGRPAPRLTPTQTPATVNFVPGDAQLENLAVLLEYIDPDCGYTAWLQVLMAVAYESDGSDEGLELANAWSSKGRKYRGIKDIEAKWKSFRSDITNPVTIATLIMRARDAGADTDAIMGGGEEQFEVCDYEVIDPTAETASLPPATDHPLARYSLLGMSQQLEKQAVEQVALLGEIALMGQANAIYAAANTGKTLLVLYLIVQAIKHCRIDPAKLFYINMDDNSTGLAEKGRIAEEFGFHLLADGHQGFEAKAFQVSMEDMIATDTARGVIVVLDTLKKFVDTMRKDKSAAFAGVVRRFVLKGGTVIALAHTNKHPGPDGKAIYAGTSDIVDDFDCAYTLATVPQQGVTDQKLVEFTNIKRRGNVAQTASYSYSNEQGLSYYELLLSVEPVDPAELGPLKQAAEAQSDAGVIAAVIDSIKAGITTKMRLADAVAQRAKVSKRAALTVIERYTGNDPAIHRWTYIVRARGAKEYAILDAPSVSPPGAARLNGTA